MPCCSVTGCDLKAESPGDVGPLRRSAWPSQEQFPFFHFDAVMDALKIHKAILAGWRRPSWTSTSSEPSPREAGVNIHVLRTWTCSWPPRRGHLEAAWKIVALRKFERAGRDFLRSSSWRRNWPVRRSNVGWVGRRSASLRYPCCPLEPMGIASLNHILHRSQVAQSSQAEPMTHDHLLRTWFPKFK